MMSKWPKYNHLKIYKMENCSKEKLINLGYRYSRAYSDSGETVYMCKLPIYKYTDFCTLEGRFLTAVETGETRIDVLDVSTHGHYAPWYIADEVHKPIIEKINKEIKKIIKKFNLKEAGQLES